MAAEFLIQIHLACMRYMQASFECTFKNIYKPINTVKLSPRTTDLQAFQNT